MEIAKHNKHAAVFGATGLIGQKLLPLLLDNDAYSKVTIFVRQPTDSHHPKLQEIPIDFSRLDKEAEHFPKAHDVFICLGTTMKKAGSRDAFRQVDYEYITRAAQAFCNKGANQLLLVSSIGAHPDSRFFYSRVKGETENSIKSLPFWSHHIFRPSVLLGERNESRWGENFAGVLGKGINKLTGGLLKKYSPIEAEVVAASMVAAAQRFVPGIHTYESDMLQDLATSYYGNSQLHRKS